MKMYRLGILAMPFVFLLFSSFKHKTSFSVGEPIVLPTNITDGELNTKIYTYKLLYDEFLEKGFKMPSIEVFDQGVSGMKFLKRKGLIKKDILTLIDFSKSSNEKRLWIIDLTSKNILFRGYVAHGKNSGEEYPIKFSNKPQSYKSSLGFYKTAETYIGKHGYSLRLDGLENGINNNARERAIVLHGADYVSKTFISKNKRLGRSHGCPAVSMKDHKKVINLIKQGSCLFIYHPSAWYRQRTKI